MTLALLASCLAAVPVCLHAEAKGTEATGYLVRLWGVDEGMPVASVTDIAQTPEGYLWVGTFLSGLQRFDGVRFMSFHAGNTPEIQGMAVRRLAVDGTGRLWVNTYANRLVTWDQRGFELARSTPTHLGQVLWASTNQAVLLDTDGRLFYGRRATPEWNWQEVSLETARQPRYCADYSGRIWYVRAGGEIGSWHYGETNVPPVAAPFTNQPVRVLLADAQGFVWLGTDQSLWVWRGGAWAVIPPPEGERVLAVKRIIPSGAAGVWVEANNRMRRWLNGSWMAESPGWMREMGGAGALSFVRGDRRGGFWASYRDRGLLRVEADGAFTRLTTRDGLPSDSIRLGVLDREGNLWTGYERGGLVQVRRQPFEVLGRQQGLPESLVNTVCEDADGTVWIGTHSGAVMRHDAKGRGTSINVVEERVGHDSLVAADFAGRVWVGVVGVGLMTLEQDTARLVASRQDLQGDPRLLLPTRDGRLWIGTLDGIWTLHGQQLVRAYDRATADFKDRPAALVEMGDGTIWAGTFSGALLRWNGTRFERVEPPNFPQLGRSWALHAGAEGCLWIGTTEGGLLRYQNGTFRRYTSRDGLPSDHIVQVMEDALGNLWLGTRVGIVRVDEAALARFDRGEIKSLPVSLYGKADGLRTIGSAIEFQPNAWVGRSGRLWFAMNNSVVSVAPEKIRMNLIPPTVVLESVVADGRPVWPQRTGAVLTSDATPAEHPAVAPPAMRVGPGHRDLEFNYTGLSLGSPQRVRFKHKLDGLDADWIEAGSQRSAVYRYVPPGEYVFRLTACNSDGVWNEESAILRVRVVPHFYQTGWFIALVLLTGAGLLAYTVRRATRRKLQRRLAEVERQHALERERSRIAQDLHDDLGAALTEVGLLSSLAQRPATPLGRIHEHLNHITTRAREMVTALDEIVWAVNPKHDSVPAFGQYLAEYTQQFLQPTPLRCHIEVENPLPAHPLNSEQRQNLLLAFKEALTNIVRHAQATEVRIALGVRDGELQLRIEDDGRGTLPQAAGSQADGLINMRRRLERIGGRCEISATPGRGTTVSFHYPLPPTDA